MISSLFKSVFIEPLYNSLVFLSSVLPWESLGGAIIILTLVVKFILLPFQHKIIKTQKQLKLIEPKLQEIKKNTKDDRSEQAKQIMLLYKTHGINPLTSFWTLLIQIPIILALFFVFKSSATLHPELIYSFTPSPNEMSLIWLGLIDLSKTYFPLALLVGVTQFIQLWLANPKISLPDSNSSSNNQIIAQKMQTQMRYILPIFIIFAASSLPSAIGLYWITSNLFAITHEWWVRRESDRLLAPPDGVAPSPAR